MYVRTNRAFHNGVFLNDHPRLGSTITLTPRILTYSTKDVIDSRISVPAQHSLVRLSKNPSTNADAVGMLEEIKAGRLAGIYCVNWKKAAQRALRFGKTWWTVIPRDEDAVLMLDPDNLSSGPPLIAFRRELDPRPEQGCGLLPNERPVPPSPTRLDAALLRAWVSYRRWRTGEVAPCNDVLHLPVRNVMPAGLCQGPPCPSPATSSPAFTSWLQASLNRVLGTKSPVTGSFDAQTRSALQKFQQRKGLVYNAQVDPATQAALAIEAGVAVPCQTAAPWSELMLTVELWESSKAPPPQRPFPLDVACAGWANPRARGLFSRNCGPSKRCVGSWDFVVYFFVDLKPSPIPSDLEMPKVSVKMDFIDDSGRLISTERESDNTPTYSGPGSALHTSFGRKFSFSSRESGNLKVQLRAVANWSGHTVEAVYTDTVRCKIIACV